MFAESYLANLSLYPGKSELPFLPPNTQVCTVFLAKGNVPYCLNIVGAISYCMLVVIINREEPFSDWSPGTFNLCLAKFL